MVHGTLLHFITKQAPILLPPTPTWTREMIASRLKNGIVQYVVWMLRDSDRCIYTYHVLSTLYHETKTIRSFIVYS